MATFNNDAMLMAAAQMMQASGPSRQPQGLGAILGGGMATYLGAAEQARQRKMEEDQAKQIAEMRALQMRDLEGTLGDKASARAQAARLQELKRGFPAGRMAPQGAANGAMQPQGQPAARGGASGLYEEQMALAQYLHQNGETQEAMAIVKAAKDLRPKYSTTPQIMRGLDGKLRNLQLAEDGSKPVELDYGVKPEMIEVGLGDRKQFVDKNEVGNNQSFKVNVSPDAVYSANASRANADATREVAKATRYAADAKRNQDTEMKLSDDYRAQSKGFKEVSDAYRTIKTSLDTATTSPAATLTAATKFMKLLDPGSVVRESELGMALAATGVIDRASNYYETLKRGKVLTPSQVADFKAITDQVYTGAKQGQVEIDNSYRNQAKTYGLRPEVIIQDLGQNPKPASAVPQAAANHLRMNPKLRDAFDAKYGAGAAASVLGK